MLAITVKPQWAWAMLHLGKRIENRDFFPDSLVGKRIALHAGKRLAGATAQARAFRDLAFAMALGGHPAMPQWYKSDDPRLFWFPTPAWKYDPARFERDAETKDRRFAGEEVTANELPHSCIFATAVIFGSVHVGSNKDQLRMWALPDKQHWFLSSFEMLEVPVPYERGQQGIYLLPADIHERIISSTARFPTQRGCHERIGGWQ